MEGKTVDLDRISGLLRRLSARQEKVIRLYFGLGCQRPHSAREIAKEFGMSAQVIAGILGAAQRNLAQEGLRFSQLREAAWQQTRHGRESWSSTESPSQFRRGGHAHHED